MSQVLVIDDSTTLRKLVEIAMRGTAVEVDFAATGSDGVARARSNQPDVILLDFLLPDLPSVEICRRLAEERATASVPVVVMSANPPSIFEAFRRFPSVVDFIGKPFSAPEIRDRLEQAIARGGPLGEAGFVAEDHDDTHAHAGTASEPPGELHLRGDLATVPLLDVLRLLAAAGATGALTIATDDAFQIYLRQGTPILCATTRFDDQLLGDVDFDAIDPELVQRAYLRQRSDGLPALVTLAHAGAVAVTDLPDQLHRLGERLLGELLAAHAGRFWWQPAAALPEFVDALGRGLSVTQIALAGHRGAADGSAPGIALDEIYDRTARFSDKLAGVRLDRDEQRLLGLIDGRTTLSEIADRAEISIGRAAGLAARLRSVGLIHAEHEEAVATAELAIAILADDRDGFVDALRAYLAGRAEPIELIAIDDPALARRRPRAILFDAAQFSVDSVAHTLASRWHGASIGLIALLDAPDAATSDALIRAGIHAVLVKPVHFLELERALGLSA